MTIVTNNFSKPKLNDKRSVVRFLWLPKSFNINHYTEAGVLSSTTTITKWLEKARIQQTYHEGGAADCGFAGWVDTKFID